MRERSKPSQKKLKTKVLYDGLSLGRAGHKTVQKAVKERAQCASKAGASAEQAGLTREWVKQTCLRGTQRLQPAHVLRHAYVTHCKTPAETE